MLWRQLSHSPIMIKTSSFLFKKIFTVLLRKVPTRSERSWKSTDENVLMFCLSLSILFIIFHSLPWFNFPDALGLVFHLYGCILWICIYMSFKSLFVVALKLQLWFCSLYHTFFSNQEPVQKHVQRYFFMILSIFAFSFAQTIVLSFFWLKVKTSLYLRMNSLLRKDPFRLSSLLFHQSFHPNWNPW